MKKIGIIASSACAILLSGTSVFAQTSNGVTTTQQFVDMCKKTTDVASQNFCQGFGQGVYETYLMTRHPNKAPNFICAENSKATRQEHLSAFIKWSAANPKFNGVSAADTILRYMAETFPCKKG